MKTKDILLYLVEQLDAFEEENRYLRALTIDDFLGYIQSQRYGSNSLQRKEDSHPEENGQEKGPNRQEAQANLLSRQVSLIYRYAKEYTKKGLEDSCLQTVEEFSYLVVLISNKSLSKTELILKNGMGKTSGIEVIKRLLRKKLIRQYADENDKRSQRLELTPLGFAELHKVFPQMQLASDIITGNLTPPEQQTLIFLLQKLEAHHRDLFLNHLDKNLEELAEIEGKKK